ncbi:MAG: T9SS type A sorting domain-containing protein [Flavobacterium sp.]|nr:T9SS type A sorting domain-containing protein [Flavobacterium sp.]
MKTKLLLVVPFFSLLCAAQAPINSYYPVNGSEFVVLSSTPPLDQSATGANATWDFTTLTQIGTSIDNNMLATNEEIAVFPNTTTNTVSTATIGVGVSESNIYSRENAGQVAITGIINSQVELNFAINNALVGTFPLNYGYSNVDDLEGSFTSGAVTGGVEGTITTSVDAYGTLNLAIDGGAITTYQVTRLKSVQNVALSYSIFGNIGTIDQTLYYYYINGGPNSPIFRTSHTVANVPLQGINNETFDQMERYNMPLGVAENSKITSLSLFPNPTQDQLHIESKDSEIREITISDMSGRIVFHSNGNTNTISLGNLQNGMYNATIVTTSGSKTEKIIKN